LLEQVGRNWQMIRAGERVPSSDNSATLRRRDDSSAVYPVTAKQAHTILIGYLNYCQDRNSEALHIDLPVAIAIACRQTSSAMRQTRLHVRQRRRPGLTSTGSVDPTDHGHPRGQWRAR
jgi:hypothetical protein